MGGIMSIAYQRTGYPFPMPILSVRFRRLAESLFFSMVLNNRPILLMMRLCVVYAAGAKTSYYNSPADTTMPYQKAIVVHTDQATV